MVQGLSLGLILPLVQFFGQRLGLPNHYYIFSVLILVARLASSIFHLIVLSSLVMVKIKSKRKTRRRRIRQKVQVLSFHIFLVKTKIFRKLPQTNKMKIDMKKRRKRRKRRRRKNFQTLMMTFFPH